MERIRPKPEIGYMLKKGGKLEILPCISEVGLFGYFLSDQGQLLKNQVGGYLIRTKVIYNFKEIRDKTRVRVGLLQGSPFWIH
jgi:hypothetical protein